MIKKLLFTVVALLGIATMASAQQLANVKIENGKGQIISTASLIDGKTPFILSFWSSTCKPCCKELAAINDQLIDWQDQAKFRVVIVSVDDSRSASKARAMVNGSGWTDFIDLYDKNQDLKRGMNVNLTPMAFVIDKNGKVVYSHMGYAPGAEAELFQQILKLQ